MNTVTKQEIRDYVRKEKRTLTKQKISDYSKEIIRNLFTCTCYKEAFEVYTYVSYNQEADTKELIIQALKDKKRVAVPKVIGEEMEFFYITSLDEVKEGYQHILEPITSEKAVPQSGSNPLMLMPGLAFDRNGNRIGYGGGFYDKYLLRYQEAQFIKCALGYEFQLFDQLEREQFDIPVDMVVTPKEIVKTNVRIANKREEVVWNI